MKSHERQFMHNFLLPYKYKWIGAGLVILGLTGLIFYMWFDFRLILPVFAVYSSFLETRIFTTFRTNIADELIMLSLLSGFLLLVFSKEKTECEILDSIRSRSFLKALLANAGLLIFSILFVYGNGFLTILLLNIFSIFIFYLLFFYLMKRKEINSQA
jgi:hypothetical protein